MPLYDFICDNCGSEYEARMPMEATHFPPCPFCSSLNTSKILTGLRVNQMQGTDSDLQKLYSMEAKKPEIPGKVRVQKLLDQMAPDLNSVTAKPMGCVDHTRQELKERYPDLL